jgi:hypothetical protein
MDRDGQTSPMTSEGQAATLLAMDAETHPGLVAPPGARWRRVPWKVPTGRRPRFWPSVPHALAYGALIGSLVSAPTVRVSAAVLGTPYVAVDVTLAVLATAYGLAFIATAGRPHPGRTDAYWQGLTATRAGSLWFGLAFVIPESVAWGISSWLFPTSSPTVYQAILWWLPAGIFVVCVVVAHSYSTRDVKRTILAGLAPSYVMSPDGGWWRNGDTWASVADRNWWNGSAWVSAAAAVPEDALRSPDGNYWWTGSAWCAMPRRARRSSS